MSEKYPIDLGGTFFVIDTNSSKTTHYKTIMEIVVSLPETILAAIFWHS